MRWRWALPLAVLVFLYALLMQAPAATLYAWFAPRNGPVQLTGIDGALKHGHVTAISFNGHPIIKDLQWHLHPLWLLLGRVALHLQGGEDATTLDGSLQWSPGMLRASPLKLDTDLKSVLAQTGFRFVPVDGLAQLNLQHLQWDGTRLRKLQGHLQLLGLRWDLGQTPLQLGDFSADATTNAQRTINAVIKSVSGPLDLLGKASLSADNTYQIDLRLRAKPGAPPQLTDMLRSLGRPDPGGYHEIHDKGRLNPTLPNLQ